MNRKSILSVTYPTVTSWQWHASLLSILETSPNTLPWIYSNYIQMIALPAPNESVTFDFTPNYDDYLHCPWIETQLIGRNFIADHYRNTMDFFRECLMKGYYLYTICDESCFIERYTSKFMHELFIYGFDKKSFYVGDFTIADSGKFSFETIASDQLRRAYENVSHEEDFMRHGLGKGVFLFKLRKHVHYRFDKLLVINSIKDYLTEGRIYDQKHIVGELSIAGIDTYRELTRLYRFSHESKSEIDLRASSVFRDHKKLMNKRVDFMAREEGIYIPHSLQIEFSHLEKEATLLQLLSIKSNIKRNHDKRVIDRIVGRYEMMREREIHLLNELLSYL